MSPQKRHQSEESIQEAVQWLHDHPTESPGAAGKLYQVSRHSLRSRLQGKQSRQDSQLEANGRLSPAQERTLVNYLKRTSNLGLAHTRSEVRQAAQMLLDEHAVRSHHEKPPQLGQNWLARFAHRHSDLMQRSARRMVTSRLQAFTKDAIDQYSDALHSVVAPTAPDCLWAMDETFTEFGYTQRRSTMFFERLPHRGDRHLPPQAGGKGDRSGCTALETVCADGEVLPPMICYRGNKPPNWEHEGPFKATYMQKNRAMGDTASMVKWLKQQFDPLTRHKAAGRTRVLMIDNASHHTTFPVLVAAWSMNIDIVTYPPNTTDVTQPHDVMLFPFLKARFDEHLTNKMRFTKSTSPREAFAGIYREAREATLTSEKVRAAFERTGIYPVDLSQLPDERRWPWPPPPPNASLAARTGEGAPSDQLASFVKSYPEHRNAIEPIRSCAEDIENGLGETTLLNELLTRQVFANSTEASLQRQRKRWERLGGHLTHQDVLSPKRRNYLRLQREKKEQAIPEAFWRFSECEQGSPTPATLPATQYESPRTPLRAWDATEVNLTPENGASTNSRRRGKQRVVDPSSPPRTRNSWSNRISPDS
ncbi:unnamed protein product [Jaminaea pallidilutea]